MKKILSILPILWMAIMSMSAQNNDDFSELWNIIMSNRSMFRLVAYGDYYEGKEVTRYYPKEESREGMVFTEDRLLHIDSEEGNVIYDVRKDGEYLHLSNKSVTKDERRIIDYRHSSWIKILRGFETEEGHLVIITVDSYGTYRYLEFFGLAPKK